MPLIDNFSLDNYRLDGPNKMFYKTGTTTVVNTVQDFQRFNYANGIYSGSRYVEVPSANLGFAPKLIILTYPQANGSGYISSPVQSMYMEYIKDSYNRSIIDNADGSGAGYPLAIGFNSYVNSSGFKLPVKSNGVVTMTWEAFGWDV